ncbi:hypothetical protein NDU88_001845 [Pleurodeles waltl]|uniref:Secreted protein n=1 Tax=Pleurodeles waltl TaxID=8319 RepID=A0AAV7P561_PLEWA|nr:hypothetical protein NDU88_001845 [Pleurodeles waltl]
MRKRPRIKALLRSEVLRGAPFLIWLSAPRLLGSAVGAIDCGCPEGPSRLVSWPTRPSDAGVGVLVA